MSRYLRTLLAVAVATLGFGVMAAGASATPTVGAPPSPGGAFSITSTVTGSNHTFAVPNTSGTGIGATVQCANATFGDASSPITGPGAPDNSATFRPVYTNCSLNIAGQVCAATVTINDSWTLRATSLRSGTAGTNGAVYNGTVTLNGTGTNANIDVTSCGLSCHITVGAQTVNPSGSGALGATDVGSSSGVSLAGQANNVAFASSGCPGVAPSGSGSSGATYTVVGTVVVPGVYIYGS